MSNTLYVIGYSANLSLEIAEPARISAEINRTFTNEKQEQI